ncbi:MAG: 2-hydroxyacyl-CoA dehydratase family protein [Pseudomonadota bacterium]
MTVIARLKAIAADPYTYTRSWKAKTGRPVIGTFCSYAPEEIILAAGALGIRLFGSGAPIDRADAHLQAYSCSLVRSALEDVLSGRLDFLDGTVFPHTCDSIQRLSDIWRLNAGVAFHADVVLPAKLNTDSSRAYTVDVFRAFAGTLETALGVRLTDERLRAAIDTLNQIRSAVRRLYAVRLTNPAALPGSDLHAVIKAGMVMARDAYLEDLTALLADIDALPRPAAGKALAPVVLSGGVCNLPDLYGVVEAAGGRVVWDDLCTGVRGFEGTIDSEGDLIANIALRYAERLVCPAKHAGNRTRGEALLECVHDTGARGVIFVVLKFCDPHGFDIPYIKAMLEGAGIPSLLLELEEGGATGGQLRTRIEAFIEMM